MRKDGVQKLSARATTAPDPVSDAGQSHGGAVGPRQSTGPGNRVAWLGLAVVILVSLIQLPGQIDQLRADLPTLRLWHRPGAQADRAFNPVPVEALRLADALLPSRAPVLLVTPGSDVYHLEYTTYHRALYTLTPRPVWWLSPAPPDGSWQSRWWIRANVDAASIEAVAAALGVPCVLAFQIAVPEKFGLSRVDLGEAWLVQVAGGPGACQGTLAAMALPPDRAFSGWPLRLALALAVPMMLGGALLGVARRRARILAREALPAAWILGCGVLSLSMFWLSLLGLDLTAQRTVIAALSLAGLGWLLARRGRKSEPVVASRDRLHPWYRKVFTFLLLGLLLVQVGFISLSALGRPLTLWDSWVNWGVKSRTLYREGSLTPSLYSDPSRSVTMQDYPLHLPFLQAWLYTWLGGVDDRLAGVWSVGYYLALVGLAYAWCRRRGATRPQATLAAAALGVLGDLTAMAAAGMPESGLAASMALAAVSLLDWWERDHQGDLAIAAIAGGLIPWTKREGLVLLPILGLLFFAFALRAEGPRKGGRSRRPMQAVAALAFAAALLAGPWWLFSGLKALSVPVFELPDLVTIAANLGRIPRIAYHVTRTLLLNPISNFVWILSGGLILIDWRGGAFKERADLAALLPAVAFAYLGSMSLSFYFSTYVPFQQHLLTSIFRLSAGVEPLLLLWIAMRALGLAGKQDPLAASTADAAGPERSSEREHL